MDQFLRSPLHRLDRGPPAPLASLPRPPNRFLVSRVILGLFRLPLSILFLCHTFEV
jgi:hypothetical protein